MKIRNLKKEDFDSLVEFNERVFPERDQVAESLKYNFFINPINEDAWQNIYIAREENENISGQFMLLPAEFFFHGNKHQAFWGMDYIVDESHRRSNIGSVLAKMAIGTNNYFTVGLSEISLKIHMALKQKVIGTVEKYIRPVTFFSLFNIIFRPKDKKGSSLIFPDIIKSKSGTFQRILDPEQIISQNGNWDPDRLEFTRNTGFIKWRFFHYKDKYFVYKFSANKDSSAKNSTYFVLRPVVWNKINCLLLVDYRQDSSMIHLFPEIIKACLKIGSKTGSTAVIAGTSLEKDIKQLKKSMFFPFRNQMKLVTRIPFDMERDQILVTFADGDCDYFFGDKHW